MTGADTTSAEGAVPESLGWTGLVMDVLAHVSRLLLVQALWIGGVVAGLGVLGVFPASVAAVHALQAQAQPVRTFLHAYRSTFARANRVGAVFLLAGVVVAADVAVSPALPGVAAPLLLAAATVAGGACAISTAFAVVALARSDGARTGAVLRFALVAPWVSPLRGLGVLAVGGALAVAWATAPPLVLLFGASAPLLLVVALVRPVVARATNRA